ncbi:hypothetical protein ABWK22_01635 [Gottfriedia acidiceleris]|uniref:hypothetical protein n=1 Tax=Gottfriedia acidiceleris TaxID=371036 RepID=UPI00339A895F
MNQTLSKEYIRNIAESVKHSTLEEVAQLEAVLEKHPRGKEIQEAVSNLLISDFIGGLIGEVFGDAKTEDCGCVDGCALEEAQAISLAEAIKSQVTTQDISKQIREQMNPEGVRVVPVFVDYMGMQEKPKDLASSIKEQVAMKNLSSMIKTQVEAAPAVDLNSLIKGQVEQQSLSTLISNAIAGQTSLEDMIFGVLDEIIDEIIEDEVIENGLSLHTASIALYEVVFATAFHAKVNELGIEDIIDYKVDYTAYIMSELAIYFTEEEGYELAFELVEGNLVPVLKG